MFLKNVRQLFLHTFSIRTRLAILYSFAAFIVLTLITLFLYWETLNILHRADYQYLSDEVEALQQILQYKRIDMDVLTKDIVEYSEKSGDSIYRCYTRIYKADNQVLIETPGMSSILPVESGFNLTNKHGFKKKYFWYSNKNTKYLIISAPIKYANNKVGIIQIALDITFQHAMMSDRKFVIIALLASTLCSLFLGFFIAHRSMRNLYALTDTVKAITVSSLHQRIDPKSLPKELSELGIAFNQMLDRIESSFTRLKQFSSDLAHELRIPINNLIGESEIALSRTHSTEEYQQVLASNLEECHRVSQLIENILFLSRAENPQIEIPKSNLKVHDEIAMVCDYYQAMADEKNISMSCTGKAELEVNSIMFRRMISNILSNALKYTEESGSIKFNINTTEDDHVQIQIEDTGIGIPQEHLPKIFDRFYRIDSARSQESGGTGLGLAIVKSIVDLHQGLITLTSVPDVGTSICVTFPKSS